MGGQDKIRPLWRHYYTGTQGLIFVVDSQDKDRIDEAKQELHKIISDREMKDCLLLVFANKQDLPGGKQRYNLCEMLWVEYLQNASSDMSPLLPVILLIWTVSALQPAEITEKLGLNRLRDRNWYVHPSCATTGEGLQEGLNWLSQNTKTK